MLLNGRFAVVATVLVLQWRASAPFTKRIYSYQDTFGVSSCHWQRSFEVNLQSCPWAFNTLVLDWAVGHGRTSTCSGVGSSTGCRRDICSTVDIHGLQGDSLLHHGLHHGLQENLCSAAWSTSSPSFFSDLSMRGFNVGGTTEYRTAITRSREGEAMEGGFSIEKTTAPGSCCHVGTSSAAQERPIVQGFADGNVAVIGHDGEKRNLCCNQEGKQKHLGSASCIGNVPGVPEGIGHGFGDSSGDGAQVKEGEVEEEEVHGGVEAAVTGYGGDDEAVAQEGSQVDAQEEPEVQELQLPCVREWQEEELGDGAAVGHLLPQGMGTCPKRKAH
ncbi:hypothetical protein QYF61_013867 [Mycteria americana]|uniref:Uncharacterized protein n=1 Tax=Mycteria americana TaxID=33587 RepID=A0AAN7RJJ4_MYCAM|nr:hypothetical protein QYF61_013867 [Mycteria americana]